MYPILALQAALVGLALLVSVPSPSVEAVQNEPQHALRPPAPAEPTRLRCRLYFGCAPVPGTSRGTRG